MSNRNGRKIYNTKLYEITSDTFNVIPLDVLKSDDVSLYSNYLRSITRYDQLGYIYWLTSKIARYFLDLRLRVNGKMSVQNMSLEIDLLDLEQNKKNSLQHNFILLYTIYLHKFKDFYKTRDRFINMNNSCTTQKHFIRRHNKCYNIYRLKRFL